MLRAQPVPASDRFIDITGWQQNSLVSTIHGELKLRTPWRESLDLAHLEGDPSIGALLDSVERETSPPSAASFQLTPEVLNQLYRANHFPELGAKGFADKAHVVFALRGCMLMNERIDAGRDLPAVAVRVARPDHVGARCLIGVWTNPLDAARSTLRVFKASTVPNSFALQAQSKFWDNASFAQYRSDGTGAPPPPGKGWTFSNTLATGLHLRTRGRHSTLLENALRSGEEQPGFRVRRMGRSSLQDHFAPGHLYDNVHCAVTLHDAHGARFSSEGCLTIAEVSPPFRSRFERRSGTAYCFEASLQDNWAKFTDAIFSPATLNLDHKLMLLSGAEAWLASRGQAPERWRYGSTGNEVDALRRNLGLSAGGQIDVETLKLADARVPVRIPGGFPVWRNPLSPAS